MATVSPSSDEPSWVVANDSLIRPFEWLTSPLSLQPLIEDHASQIPNRKALHVGCGSSTVGEYLLEELGFEFVVDVDKDEETMENMRQRWQQKAQSKKTLELCVLDFTKSPFPYPDNFFGLVLDKSTLDCTLCSDNATASLLIQVYRCLAVGGVYLLISFHEEELLLPLLTTMPGACWEVTCTTMQRQVESIGESSTTAPAGTTSSSGNSKLLNVVIARKAEPSHDDLDFDSVCRHVHHVNDTWFQQHQPLLTRPRTQALRESFENSSLPLVQAYAVMFTEAEREHLTYDHFLEDWQAFLNDKEDLAGATVVTFDVALAFLTEMQ
jgi:SAM-dependent methyltransferase